MVTQQKPQSAGAFEGVGTDLFRPDECSRLGVECAMSDAYV